MSDKPMPETISFLLAKIGKAHRDSADNVLARVGLYVGQEMFLLYLWEEDGLTQSELAQRMCVQPPTVNKMLSRMEVAGLVERRPDADDNRASRVYLTDKSRDLRLAVERAWDSLEERTTANFSVEERVLLRRLLLQVYENLKRSRT